MNGTNAALSGWKAPMLCFLLNASLMGAASAQESPQPAAADSTYQVDLATVLRLAGAQNLDVQLARNAADEAHADYASAVERFLPSFVPSASYLQHNGRDQRVEGPLLDVSKHSDTAGAYLTAQIPVGDAIFTALQTHQLAAASDAGATAQERDSALAAAQQYFDLVKAQALVGVVGDALSISQSYERQLSEAVRIGIAFKGDAIRVQTQTQRLQLDLTRARQEQRLSAARLVQTLHLEPLLELVPAEREPAPLALADISTPPKELIRTALENRPELARSTAQIGAAEQSRRGAIFGPLIPTIGAQAFAGEFNGGGDVRVNGPTVNGGGLRQDYTVGLSWKIGPGGLFDLGRIRASDAKLTAAQLSDEKLRDQVSREVVDGYTQVQSLFEQLRVARLNLSSAEDTLRLTRHRKELGVGIVLEDIQAQQELLKARSEYVVIVTQLNQQQYGLMRSVGAPLRTAILTSPSVAASRAEVPPLQLQSIADIPLGGNPTRLDYASFDAVRHLLFIAHLGDSEVIVFDTEARRVVKRIANVSHVHGVLAIPELGRAYASATGTNEVVAIDEETLKISARMPGGIYPDGLAYSREAHKVYVSDEHGGTDTVLDVLTNTRVATVQIGGEIGNTQYDEFSHHIFISAQSANQLVEVDPKTDMIVRRIPVPGAKENHGLLIDSASHRAFVACQGNDQLIVIDLRTGAAIAQFPVAKDPDVLAFDERLQTLYVAGESGQVSEFKVSDGQINKTGESWLARNAHVVAIHPMTHEIYFPLMDIDGKPVLRIMRGGKE